MNQADTDAVLSTLAWFSVTVGPFIAVAAWHGFLERIKGGRFDISVEGPLVRGKTDLGTIVVSPEWVEFTTKRGLLNRLEISGGKLLVDYRETRRWAIFQESLKGMSALDTARVFRDVMIEGTLILAPGHHDVPFFRVAQFRPKDALLEPYYGFLREHVNWLYGFRDMHEYTAMKVNVFGQACRTIGVEVEIVPDVSAT